MGPWVLAPVRRLHRVTIRLAAALAVGLAAGVRLGLHVADRRGRR